jgi:uncharacterized protein (TIGR02271 family)
VAQQLHTRFAAGAGLAAGSPRRMTASGFGFQQTENEEEISMKDESRRIAPLDELDNMKVADEDPDVRGWDVVAADGHRIGEVDNLIVDTSAMKVRYLSVELERGERGASGDRSILIPVGQARLDENNDRVFVNDMHAEQLRSAPTYSGRFDRDYEDSVRTHFSGGRPSTSTSEGDYYADRSFDDASFYGARRGSSAGRTSQERGRDDRVTLSEEQLEVNRRPHEAGEVRVGKHVETEHVRQEVPVRHEEVEIERRPITGDRMDATPRIGEDEIRVPVMEEGVVVQKRTVPTEEIVVRKRQVEETETVEADLRRERVDIDERGDVDVTRDSNARDKR